jgi:hypothetical protein
MGDDEWKYSGRLGVSGSGTDRSLILGSGVCSLSGSASRHRGVSDSRLNSYCPQVEFAK